MTNNDPQRQSASYRLAALDEDFILGDLDTGRLHSLLEYAKAEEQLRKWGVISTMVAFGSARTKPAVEGDPGQAASTPSPELMSRQVERTAGWYEQARRLGCIASERGGALQSRKAGRA